MSEVSLDLGGVLGCWVLGGVLRFLVVFDVGGLLGFGRCLRTLEVFEDFVPQETLETKVTKDTFESDVFLSYFALPETTGEFDVHGFLRYFWSKGCLRYVGIQGFM